MPSESTRVPQLNTWYFWHLALIEQALAAIVFDMFLAVHGQCILR